MAALKKDLLRFMSVVSKLKSLKRTGWVRRGVNNPEHVADHMYMMAMMTFFIEDKHNLNKERCMKLALVHDMAECVVGDITPFCGVSKTEKIAQEREAMEQITSLAGQKVGQELIGLWEEYEAQTTAEARFVKNLDRFDMILQAHQYEKNNGEAGKLEEFFDSTKGKFDHPMVNNWAEQLQEHRKTSGVDPRTTSTSEYNGTENT